MILEKALAVSNTTIWWPAELSLLEIRRVVSSAFHHSSRLICCRKKERRKRWKSLKKTRSIYAIGCEDVYRNSPYMKSGSVKCHGQKICCSDLSAVVQRISERVRHVLGCLLSRTLYLASFGWTPIGGRIDRSHSTHIAVQVMIDVEKHGKQSATALRGRGPTPYRASFSDLYQLVRIGDYPKRGALGNLKNVTESPTHQKRTSQ
jgi:hypothetical protein